MLTLDFKNPTKDQNNKYNLKLGEDPAENKKKIDEAKAAIISEIMRQSLVLHLKANKMVMPRNIIAYVQSDLRHQNRQVEYEGMVKVLNYIKQRAKQKYTELCLIYIDSDANVGMAKSETSYYEHANLQRCRLGQIITVRKDPPADADAMAEEEGKYEKYFSEKPGSGD